MSRHNLTDQEWKSIRVFLPAERNGRAGRPWKCHRTVVNGILWVLCTGCSWKDIPPEFGKHKTIYNRFRRWVDEGLWLKIVTRIVCRLDQSGKIDRSLWCVDSSIIRAHQAAAGALRKHFQIEESLEKQALGRSRGGFSCKIHLLTDGNGIPLGVTATPGQKGETPELQNLYQSSFLSTHYREKRPQSLAGDKAYSSAKTRAWLNRNRIKDIIPRRKNERTDHAFQIQKYKRRNVVERCIGWLKHFRRVATRYEKLKQNYIAMIQIAMIRILLRRV